MQVHEIGEQGLLKRLQSFCPGEIIGDDAALLAVAAGYSLVVTTDTLVDGVHFSDRTTNPADAGWRAAAANLSDLAAMGATPLGLTVGLGLPGAVEVAWVEQLYQGMTDCLQPFGAVILGGDICRSPVISVSITALGQVLPAQAIRRAQARPGDAIVVTGVHGASRAGLELLLHPEQGQGLSAADRAAMIRSHQRPQPRFDAVLRLQGILDGELGEWGDGGDRGDGEDGETRLRCGHLRQRNLGQLAGMDSSDGLADAVLQLCRASRVGAVLERNLIPFPPCLTAWVTEAQAVDWALYGGEDFELVLCMPRTVAQKLVDQLSEAAIIGTITANPVVVLKDSSGFYPDEVLSLERGFQHF